MCHFCLEPTQNKLVHPTSKGDGCSSSYESCSGLTWTTIYCKMIEKDDELKCGVLKWTHSQAQYFCAAGVTALPDNDKNVSV